METVAHLFPQRKMSQLHFQVIHGLLLHRLLQAVAQGPDIPYFPAVHEQGRYGPNRIVIAHPVVDIHIIQERDIGPGFRRLVACHGQAVEIGGEDGNAIGHPGAVGTPCPAEIFQQHMMVCDAVRRKRLSPENRQTGKDSAKEQFEPFFG